MRLLNLQEWQLPRLHCACMVGGIKKQAYKIKGVMPRQHTEASQYFSIRIGQHLHVSKEGFSCR